MKSVRHNLVFVLSAYTIRKIPQKARVHVTQNVENLIFYRTRIMTSATIIQDKARLSES